jgi:hypothetical protein
LVSYKKLLDEDERHQARRRKGKCDKTVSRRIYVRDYHFKPQDLLSDKNRGIKQVFIPIGIICITCGYAKASLRGLSGYRCYLKNIIDDKLNSN